MSLSPENAPQFVKQMFQTNPIVVISATYCTYCHKVKTALIQENLRFVTLEIDVIPNGREVFAEVHSRTGVNTVPQVFAHGKYIGGYDDVADLQRDGKLKDIIHKK